MFSPIGGSGSGSGGAATAAAAVSHPPPPPPPPPPWYLISTHAQCYDGHAAAVLLELYCHRIRAQYQLRFHNHYRSFMEELGEPLARAAGRPVHLLLFDVAPDEGLLAYVRATPTVCLTAGDHHEANRRVMEDLAKEAHPRIQALFSTELAGVQLAWNWVATRLGRLGAARLGYCLDTEVGMGSRVLNVIARADLMAHKGDPEADAVDAAMRMREGPHYDRVKALVCEPGWYNSLLWDGPLCVRIRDAQTAALIQRGSLLELGPALAAELAADAGVPSPCRVFYVQGVPFLTAEMGVAAPPEADMVWVWSKNEAAGDNKYAVAIRRGANCAGLRCDLVARALAPNGGGHAAAAGVGLPHEPVKFLVEGGAAAPPPPPLPTSA